MLCKLEKKKVSGIIQFESESLRQGKLMVYNTQSKAEGLRTRGKLI